MSRAILPAVFLSGALISGVVGNPVPNQVQPPPAIHSFVDYEGDDENTGDDYDVFYDRLSSDGVWYDDDTYGYVFQPTVAAETSDWRPYSDGRWVWTDRGWYWDTDENFGWATYHYGRWVLVSGVGWVWVPGREWAPAWVSWRQSDDDVGWAPLPPECTVTTSFAVSSWCDTYYGIGPAAYLFIRFGDWGRPSYRGYWIPPSQNLTVFNQSRNITNIYNNNSVINNYGPQVATLQQRLGQPIPRYNINYQAQTDPKAAFHSLRQGNQLQVLAPPAQLKQVASIHPTVKRQLGAAQVERGWQNVPAAQRTELQQKLAKAAPAPQNAPPKTTANLKPQFLTKRAGKPGQPGVPPVPANAGAKPGVPGAGPGPQQPKSITATEQKPVTTGAKAGQPGPAVENKKTANQPPVSNGATGEAQKLEQNKAEQTRQAELGRQHAEQLANEKAHTQQQTAQRLQAEKAQAEQVRKQQEVKKNVASNRIAEATHHSSAKQEQARIVTQQQTVHRTTAVQHTVTHASAYHPASAPHPAPPRPQAARAPQHAPQKGGGGHPPAKGKKDQKPG